jgi:hypothetical protein
MLINFFVFLPTACRLPLAARLSPHAARRTPHAALNFAANIVNNSSESQ